MKDILKKLAAGGTLDTETAARLMQSALDGEFTNTQLGAALAMMRMRGETADEITGFAESMRKAYTTVPHQEPIVLDTCGTGGDGASTFNISTASAILVSSLGVKVAKHGNRAVSSRSGSADVLEALGIPVQSTPLEAGAALTEKNMCFLYAPAYHPSLKHVAELRRELGFRTIFNLLGPLSNPAGSTHQVLGVFDENLAEKMAHALIRLGTDHSLVVAGAGGLDEISVTGPTVYFQVRGQKVVKGTINPESYDLKTGELSDLKAASVEESRDVIEAVFHNRLKNTPAESAVIINAAAGLYVTGFSDSLKSGVETAKDALRNGSAARQLGRLQVPIKEVKRFA